MEKVVWKASEVVPMNNVVAWTNMMCLWLEQNLSKELGEMWRKQLGLGQMEMPSIPL